MVTLTPRAADEVRSLLARKHLPQGCLRFYVYGGGCSGLTYGMDIVDAPGENDVQFVSEGVSIAVDAKSLPYVDGSTIDFTEGLMGGGFQVENPNAAGSCGCGTSFQPKGATGECGTREPSGLPS